MQQVSELLCSTNESLERILREGGATDEDAKALDRMQKSVGSVFELIDDLKRECEGDKGDERIKLDQLEAAFLELRTTLRKKRLELKHKREEAERNDRIALLKGNSREGDREKRKAMEKVEAAKLAGAELSESMRQATIMMKAEVERSVAAVQALESSTQILDKVRNQHSIYESVLGLSSTILRDIHRGSIMDKLILFGGLGFFLLTVLYIVWKRTWIPGLSLLLPQKKIVVDTVTKVTTTVATSITRTTPTPVLKGNYHHHGMHDEL